MVNQAAWLMGVGRHAREAARADGHREPAASRARLMGIGRHAERGHEPMGTASLQPRGQWLMGD